jgi:general secretion pathway protein I
MNAARGFTLLEALVALAILAIGLAAAMRALGMATQSVGELRERQMAEWVAQNHLAELRAWQRFPGIGAAEGDSLEGGQRFHWREDVRATPNPLFRRVDVRVFAAGGDNALAHLSGFAVQPLR